MGAVLASWATASRWRGHPLTVRSTALLVLSGCVVDDEGLVLLVCLTFVSLVRGVLGRGEEGAGAVDIDVVARFWNKRTLRRCHRLCVRQQGIAGTSLGWRQSAVLCCPFWRQFLQSAAAYRPTLLPSAVLKGQPLENVCAVCACVFCFTSVYGQIL